MNPSRNDSTSSADHIGQDDGFHPGFDDRFASFRVFLNWDRHPNELSIAEVSLVRGLVAGGEPLQREGNDEIVLNRLENIIDNRRRRLIEPVWN